MSFDWQFPPLVEVCPKAAVLEKIKDTDDGSTELRKRFQGKTLDTTSYQRDTQKLFHTTFTVNERGVTFDIQFATVPNSGTRQCMSELGAPLVEDKDGIVSVVGIGLGCLQGPEVYQMPSFTLDELFTFISSARSALSTSNAVPSNAGEGPSTSNKRIKLDAQYRPSNAGEGYSTSNAEVEQVNQNGQYPYHVAIIKKGTNKILCDGVIISNHWVMTMKECLEGVISFDDRFGINHVNQSPVALV